MTFIHHKNGTKERFCPSMGTTLTIEEQNGKIKVKSDLPETSIYEKGLKNYEGKKQEIKNLSIGHQGIIKN